MNRLKLLSAFHKTEKLLEYVTMVVLALTILDIFGWVNIDDDSGYLLLTLIGLSIINVGLSCVTWWLKERS